VVVMLGIVELACAKAARAEHVFIHRERDGSIRFSSVTRERADARTEPLRWAVRMSSAAPVADDATAAQPRQSSSRARRIQRR
jgi:hypothetical protein